MIYHFRSTPIFYAVQGTGPTMVLLHGFLESSSMWDYIAESLSEKYTLVTIDLPGHGKSGVIDQVHSMELMADVVYEILQELKIEDAIMVGHSMGGYVALAFAERYPKIVNHLVLLNSTSQSDSPERKIQRERALKFIEKEKDMIVSMAINNLFSPEVRENYTPEIEQLKQEALSFPTEGIMAAICGMKEREDRTNILKEFSKRKTLICGLKDPIISYTASEKIAEITHSELKTLDGSHMSWIENRGEIVKILHFID